MVKRRLEPIEVFGQVVKIIAVERPAVAVGFGIQDEPFPRDHAGAYIGESRQIAFFIRKPGLVARIQEYPPAQRGNIDDVDHMAVGRSVARQA